MTLLLKLVLFVYLKNKQNSLKYFQIKETFTNEGIIYLFYIFFFTTGKLLDDYQTITITTYYIYYFNRKKILYM